MSQKQNAKIYHIKLIIFEFNTLERAIEYISYSTENN